ncbi:MAG TPA: DUF4421 domain-containing protein [Chitinophagaceae bacterium]|nr:DUF4421 domain-containing protein [Chitinophagaceae bacterium]
MIKKNILPALTIALCSVFIFDSTCVIAQKKIIPHDSTYFTTYPDAITARLYLSKKYAPFTLPASGNVEDIIYKPNTKMNLGIGATYKNYSLNVAYGFSFINKSYKDKGSTKGLDLHFHLFPTKLTVDVLGVFHKGYYLTPKGYAVPNANTYYYRPDVKITLFGLAAYRVPNGEKFSYRAAFVQNEWQTKSAGSLLYGGEAYYVSFSGDSALVPKQIQSGYPQAGIKKINFISIGPGIGYAYTLVIEKHFFITASLIGNMDLNFTSEEGTATNKKFSVKPAAVYKGAAGYNSNTWSLAATLTGNALLVRGASSSKDYFLPVGNYRLTLAKKIMRKH